MDRFLLWRRLALVAQTSLAYLWDLHFDRAIHGTDRHESGCESGSTRRPERVPSRLHYLKAIPWIERNGRNGNRRRAIIKTPRGGPPFRFHWRKRDRKRARGCDARLHLLRLVELEKRSFSQFELMRRAREILRDYPDLRTSVSDVSAIGGGANGDSRIFKISLQGPDIQQLGLYADDLKAKLRTLPGLVDIDSTLSMRKPDCRFISTGSRDGPWHSRSDDCLYLRVLVGGQIVSTYKEGSEQYDVWLRADKISSHPVELGVAGDPFTQSRAGGVESHFLAPRTARPESDRSPEPSADGNDHGAPRPGISK